MERLIKLTLRYFEERSRVSCMYLSFFLSAFRLMLVSNPTVSSMIYIVAEPVEISISGRKWSPVIMQGERKPGRSAYIVEFLMHCNVDAMKCKAELCLHVYRPSSRYDLQPATIWRRDSGFKQKEQSGDEESFHLWRFVRLASVLLRYRTVKLKMFFGKLLCAEDHIELSWVREWFKRK